jgi:hypothetical protein
MHFQYDNPLIVNNKIITQAECFGRFVGRLDLTIKNKKVTVGKYELIPADFSVAEDPAIKKYLEEKSQMLYLQEPLSPKPESQNTLGAYIAAAVKEVYPCDGVVIRTDYMKDMPQGLISPQHFFDSLWVNREHGMGPGKEYSPEQIVDFMTGRLITGETILYNSEELTSLVACTVPISVVEKLKDLSQSDAPGLHGLPVMYNYYFSLPDTANITGEKQIIIDMKAWIDLYEMGILTASYRYKNLQKEIIHVLLDKG